MCMVWSPNNHYYCGIPWSTCFILLPGNLSLHLDETSPGFQPGKICRAHLQNWNFSGTHLAAFASYFFSSCKLQHTLNIIFWFQLLIEKAQNKQFWHHELAVRRRYPLARHSRGWWIATKLRHPWLRNTVISYTWLILVGGFKQFTISYIYIYIYIIYNQVLDHPTLIKFCIYHSQNKDGKCQKWFPAKPQVRPKFGDIEVKWGSFTCWPPRV